METSELARPHKQSHFLAVTVSMTFLTAFGLLSLILYWLIRPYDGFTKFEIISDAQPVVQGGLYQWSVNHCIDNSIPLPVTINREIELQNHKTRFPLPVISYIVSERCESYSRAAVIPEDTPPGTYHLHVHTSIKVNPFRTVDQEFTGNNFEIVLRTLGLQGPQGVQGIQGVPGQPGKDKK